jgi:hypothetical protein
MRRPRLEHSDSGIGAIFDALAGQSLSHGSIRRNPRMTNA